MNRIGTSPAPTLVSEFPEADPTKSAGLFSKTSSPVRPKIEPYPGGMRMTQPQVIPYLIVNGAARAFELYAQAFGAVEVLRLTEPGGRVGHGEIRIGESRVMLADEYP